MNTKEQPNNGNNFNIPSSIINTGKFLQFLSTSLAAKYTFKLFTTPPKFKTPERELMMCKSAKNHTLKVPSIDKEVTIYEYGYSKTKILLAHGWAGRGTQLYEIADKLLENGMMVVAYDAPAHGQSQGKQTDLPECIETLKHINETFGPFDAAVGHSFGGITILNVQAEQPIFKRIVTIGIEGSIGTIIDEFTKKIQLKQKVATKVKEQIGTAFKSSVETLSPYEVAKKIDIPILVLHDTQDKDVDVSSAFRLRQNLKNGLLLITNGLGHRKILRDPKVIQRIIEFIKT